MMNLISIHTSAREVTGTSWRPGRWLYQFQSTLPQGKWLHPPRFMMYWSDFNPHFRKGSDSMFEKIMRFFNLFQSTLPQGKWPCVSSSWPSLLAFQSTLPQGKWLSSSSFTRSAIPISIHTSAREVTPLGNPDKNRIEFQSTLPQGKWRCGYPGCDQQIQISIHTSAREVTYCIRYGYNQKRYFNPHFRKGSDVENARRYAAFLISIHTSAREVTGNLNQQNTNQQISIHTSAREVTNKPENPWSFMGNFNPHFRKGSDWFW